MKNTAQGIYYNPQNGTSLRECAENAVTIMRTLIPFRLYPYIYLHYNGMFFVVNDKMDVDMVIGDVERRIVKNHQVHTEK
jgi:hypothetical protein